MDMPRVLTLSLMLVVVIGGGLVTIHAGSLIATGNLYNAVSLLSSIIALTVATVYGYYAYMLGVFNYLTIRKAEKFRLCEETDSLLRSLGILSNICKRMIMAYEARIPDTSKITISDSDKATVEKHVYMVKDAIISARAESSTKIRPLDQVDRMASLMQKNTLDTIDVQNVRGIALSIAEHITDTRLQAKSRA